MNMSSYYCLAGGTTWNTPRYPIAEQSLASTHEVLNQPPALEKFQSVRAGSSVAGSSGAGGASWARQDLQAFGARVGQSDYIELGFLANENKPVLHTHDRFGHRVDWVKFHPAYHTLMQTAIEEGFTRHPGLTHDRELMWPGPQSVICSRRLRRHMAVPSR